MNKLVIEILKEWIEEYYPNKDFNSLLDFYEKKYKNIKVKNFKTSENSINIEPVQPIEQIKISIKISDNSY